MNAFVFDISSSLRRTEDVDAAISTLKATLAVGHVVPSVLLYDELLDCLANAETYFTTYSIFSALVFAFGCEFKKREASSSVVFPRTLESLLCALQDASVQSMGGLGWRKSLLVIKLFVYCLQRDFCACFKRNLDAASPTSKCWVLQTRASFLLRDEDESMSDNLAESYVRNDWILQAVGFCTTLWKRLKNGDGSKDAAQVSGRSALEEGDTSDALLQLIEVLFCCTTQADNVVQRIHAGMGDLRADTQDIFLVMIQSEELKVRLAEMETCVVESERDHHASTTTTPVTQLSDFEQLALEIVALTRQAFRE